MLENLYFINAFPYRPIASGKITKRLARPSPIQKKTISDARNKITMKRKSKIQDARDIIAINKREKVTDARQLLSMKTKTSNVAKKKPGIPPHIPHIRAVRTLQPDDMMAEEVDIGPPIASIRRTVKNDMFLSS